MRFVIYTFFELFGSEEYSKGSSRKWVKALSAFNWKMMRELTIVDRNVETRNFPNRFSLHKIIPYTSMLPAAF
jgi:hypothetical protein